MNQTINTKRAFFTLAELVANPDNVRLTNNGDHLLESIFETGLETPLMVESINGVNTVIKGNCRLTAINTLKEMDEARFKVLFPKGIPTDLIQDELSPLDRAILIADHGTVKGLASPYELALSSNLIFHAGKNEGEVVAILSSSIDQVYPLRGAKTLNKLSEARKMGPKAHLDELKKVRRGLTQYLKAIAYGPVISLEYLKACAMGEPHYKITQYDTSNLAKAQKDDFNIKGEHGVTPYTRSEYGPNVQAIIDLLANKEASVKDTGPKMKSFKDIQALAELAESKAVKTVLAWVLGAVSDNNVILDLDKEMK